MSLTVAEQFAIVAKQAHAEMQTIVMYVCLAALVALVAILAVCAFGKYMTPVIVWMKRHRLDVLFLAPVVIAFMVYGSTKPEPGPGTNTIKAISLASIVETPNYLQLSWDAAQGYDLTGKTVRIQARDLLTDGIWSEWKDLAVLENCTQSSLIKSGFFVGSTRELRVLVEDYR